MPRERATELEYFKWIFNNMDFGPAHADVVDQLNEDFMDATGKNIPEGWNFAQDGETVIDRGDPYRTEIIDSEEDIKQTKEMFGKGVV